MTYLRPIAKAQLTADLFAVIDEAIEVTTNGNAIVLRYASPTDRDDALTVLNQVRSTP